MSYKFLDGWISKRAIDRFVDTPPVPAVPHERLVLALDSPTLDAIVSVREPVTGEL